MNNMNSVNKSIDNFVQETYHELAYPTLMGQRILPTEIELEIPTPDGNKFVKVKISTEIDTVPIKKSFLEKIFGVTNSYPARIIGYKVTPLKMTDREGNNKALDTKINQQIIDKCTTLLKTSMKTATKKSSKQSQESKNPFKLTDLE